MFYVVLIGQIRAQHIDSPDAIQVDEFEAVAKNQRIKRKGLILAVHNDN
jgi:hypothetical protein